MDPKKEGGPMAANVTLLDLVSAVTDQTSSEAETIALVAHLVNEGHFRLCGNFKGERFDLTALAAV